MRRRSPVLFIFSLALLTVCFAWNLMAPQEFHSVYLYFIVLYFYATTAIVHRFLVRTNERSPKDFIRAYMGSTALRLFVNLMVIVVFMLADRSHAMFFSLSFLVFYFIYLVFEIVLLQKDLRKKD
jgi:hypothetical protein